MEAPTYRFFAFGAGNGRVARSIRLECIFPIRGSSLSPRLSARCPSGVAGLFLDQRPLTLFNRLETRMNEALARVRRIKVGRVTSPPGAS